MKPWLALLLLVSPAAALSPGDGVVVRFKDGSALSGVLGELGGGRVEIEVGGARLSWLMDSVERIEVRRTDLEEFRARERALEDGDAEGARRLARFARTRGLHTMHARLVERYGLEDEAVYLAREPAALPRQAASGPRPAKPDAALPALGFGADPPAGGTVKTVRVSDPIETYYPLVVLVATPKVYTAAEQEAFLREQNDRREAFRRRPTTQMEAFQFRLQEASDRQARGLSYASDPF